MNQLNEQKVLSFQNLIAPTLEILDGQINYQIEQKNSDFFKRMGEILAEFYNKKLGEKQQDLFFFKEFGVYKDSLTIVSINGYNPHFFTFSSGKIYEDIEDVSMENLLRLLEFFCKYSKSSIKVEILFDSSQENDIQAILYALNKILRKSIRR
ncbi:hypothetical protein DOK78_001208 [Enterococcus sp. DIV2402]|uniref:Uncharacterized protein n=1 Tax=Candidatus Enterococcus lowellii TaxID=2230877 RepID=A0ABZ2SL50_9ENTE|nr:hypothetical protein [Enterococcus sp. DIV2402]MBO0464593.1 hypothetical protein [Enterococcus sp. DIV2402]